MAIPNIIHFVYFGGRPLGLVEYLAVRSAIEVNKPEVVYWYGDEELSGEWGEKILKLVCFEKVKTINVAFGVAIVHPAHKADILRLQKLIERGGIYLDLDVICRNPFTPLLNNRVVLGKEVNMGKLVGLCNAVILAQKQENYTRRFLEGFDPNRSLWQGFRSTGPKDIYYSEISIKYSHFLANYWPEEIYVEDEKSFYYPNYEEGQLREFFIEEDRGQFDKCYCHHLWGSAVREKYFANLDTKGLKEGKSPFAKLVARYI